MVEAENELRVCKSAVPSSIRFGSVIRKNARAGLTIQKTSGDSEFNVTATRPFAALVYVPESVPFEEMTSC